ncbi:MAG: AAA family ATPase, partial [Clostridium sp.]|nr:AAA family ATPase [Clostridium sp.]
MIFERKIYSRLLAWKKKNGRTALLIEGARRIGKSTIVGEFARREYKSFILVDFNNLSKAVKEAFDNYLGDFDTLFMLLASAFGTQLYRRESLIVFDEVQKYPKVRQAIKYLVADGRYDYIETGSLISIRENVKDITIPSEEESVKMFPMDFEEFLWAAGEKSSADLIRNAFAQKQPLPQAFHHKMMLLLRQYLIVG